MDPHAPARLNALRTLRRTRDLVGLLWPHARSHRGLLLGGALLSAAVVALRVAQPWPLKWILDLLTGTPVGPAVDLGVAGLSALYVVFVLAASVAEYGQLLALAGLGNRVLYGFRTQLFTHVLRQPLAFHEARDEGELLTRIVYDTARLRQGVNNLLTRVFQTAITFAATSAVLLWIDARLAAVLAMSGLLVLVAMARTSRRIVRAARKQRRREGKLAGIVAEDLLGIRELQAYRTGAPHDPRFARHNVKSLRQEQKVRRLGAMLVLRTEVLLAVAVTVILWVGARTVQAGGLTPGDLVLFVSYAVGLYRPFGQFARQSARSGKTFACAERLANIMARKPDLADRPGAVTAPPLHGAIRFDDVSVRSPRRRRGGRKWALREASFGVGAGERVAILGPNGSGKSTVLRLVLRLADPAEGSVQIDGRDLRDYAIASLRHQMSVVFQESVFFGLSVRDNIALGGEGAGPDEIQAAARRAKASELIERLPEGYDTPLRRRGGLLSGGERQRIALARALLRDGRIWLLDEPTTGLDAPTAADLIAMLLDATRDRTTLWVTHDAAVLPFLDRVVVLEEGRVAFTGAPEEYGRWFTRRVARPTGVTTGEP
ncbi:MAG: ABC transporter ATP-binding protein [Gemmatimonadales bacterium]